MYLNLLTVWFVLFQSQFLPPSPVSDIHFFKKLSAVLISRTFLSVSSTYIQHPLHPVRLSLGRV
jgi:hypothetical protein